MTLIYTVERSDGARMGTFIFQGQARKYMTKLAETHSQFSFRIVREKLIGGEGVMAVVDNKEEVDAIIAANGVDPKGGDRPLCVKVVKYTDMFGRTCYGLIYEGQHPDNYHECLFCNNLEVIWERNNGST